MDSSHGCELPACCSTENWVFVHKCVSHCQTCWVTPVSKNHRGSGRPALRSATPCLALSENRTRIVPSESPPAPHTRPPTPQQIKRLFFRAAFQHCADPCDSSLGRPGRPPARWRPWGAQRGLCLGRARARPPACWLETAHEGARAVRVPPTPAQVPQPATPRPALRDSEEPPRDAGTSPHRVRSRPGRTAASVPHKRVPPPENSRAVVP